MSGVDPFMPEVRPYQLAHARALRTMVDAGRRELQDGGKVRALTWDTIDAILGELIEQLPPRPQRRV